MVRRVASFWEVRCRICGRPFHRSDLKDHYKAKHPGKWGKGK